MIEKAAKTIWSILKKCMYTVIDVILKIFHRELSEDSWNALLQFVKFGFIGISNTVVSYVINIIILFSLQLLHLFPSVDYYIANIVAFLLSVLWSFYWNNKYVFRCKKSEKKNLLGSLFKTYISYAFTGIVLSNVLSYIWVEVCHISKYAAPLVNSIIGVPINFVLNKFWAFNGK